jgi:hypothetical protein
MNGEFNISLHSLSLHEEHLYILLVNKLLLPLLHSNFVILITEMKVILMYQSLKPDTL